MIKANRPLNQQSEPWQGSYSLRSPSVTLGHRTRLQASMDEAKDNMSGSDYYAALERAKQA